jgi:crooked neck
VQPQLDMPELLWKAYIDFEEEEAEYERTRALYERLLEKTEHVKVWTSYAHFEINVPETDISITEEDEEAPISDAAKARARSVFQRAHKLYKSRDLTAERVALLNAWKSFEDAHGGDEDKEAIAKQMPRKVKKRRRLDDDSFEEYMDYVFPADDAGAAKMSKLMAKAQAWRREQEAGGAAAAS